MTIEAEDAAVDGVNMVFPRNEIRKTAREALQDFDHALCGIELNEKAPSAATRRNPSARLPSFGVRPKGGGLFMA